MKIRPVGAELFRVDGRADVTKLIAAFLSSVNAPKNKTSRHHLPEDGNRELSSLLDEFSAFILGGAYFTTSYPRRP
jgi:hypothetical protein